MRLENLKSTANTAKEPAHVGQGGVVHSHLMKDVGLFAFYCPLCRKPRASQIRPEVGTLKHFLQVGILTAVVTLALYPWFDWKGVVSFLPLWVIFEVSYRSKVRQSLKCLNCGFDPVLYLKDVGLARKEVESFWQEKLKTQDIKAGVGAAQQPSPPTQ